MFPQKSRTQIIADLLTSALDELEQNLPEAVGYPISDEEEHNERMVAEHLGEDYVSRYSILAARAAISADWQTNISPIWSANSGTKSRTAVWRNHRDRRRKFKK